MLSSQSRVLGEFLIDRHVLSRDDLAIATAESRRTGDPLPAVLHRNGLVGEKDLSAAIAETVGLRFIDFTEYPMHPDAATTIPELVARDRVAVGVGFEGTKLVVAFADPGDDDAVQAVGTATGYEIIPAAAGRYEILHALDSVYGPDRSSAPSLDEPEAGIPDEPEGLHVNELLIMLLDQHGSDLHLTAGSPPVIRVHGELRPVPGVEPINGSDIREMIYAILTQKQRERFETDLELDCSYTLPGKSRFRMNVFLQRDSVGAVLRAIPYEIVDFDLLGLPPSVKQFADLPRGLVLVTGPTGSGKSTTLASLVDIVNRTKALHIMTVEDPIEFLHSHKRAVVNQREVGEDTHSFAEALRHVLRQDPDVILVGEMRDLDTISTALTAAETGHLVFATLHTQDAPQSIDRIIDVFPSHQQQQIRVQLASSLQGICTQQLLKTADGTGRVVAAEVLVATPAVRNLIREGKIYQIYSLMQAGGKFGMVTMDQTLAGLVKAGTITREMRDGALHERGRPPPAHPEPGLGRLMPTTFAYKVRDQGGRIVEGSLEADDKTLVIGKLRQMGYTPVAIEEQSARSLTSDVKIPGMTPRVKLKSIAVFSRQFATMINSGLSLIRSLAILTEQTEDPQLAKVAGEIRLDVERGSSLSAALSRHPKVFNHLYVAMVKSGEAGGVLDAVLMRLADTIEKQVELRRKVKSAMTYPIVVLTICSVIATAMLLLIVPQFKSIYADLGGTLPLPTRILISVSDLLKTFFPIVVLLGVAGFFGFRKWSRSDQGRPKWDAFKLRVPVAGALTRKAALARFSRTLSALDAFRCRHPGGTRHRGRDCRQRGDRDRGARHAGRGQARGHALAPAGTPRGVPPDGRADDLGGEETGALDEMLDKIADFYDQEVSATVDALTSLIEPMLICLMGVIVGGMIISLYLPMFNIIKLIK